MKTPEVKRKDGVRFSLNQPKCRESVDDLPIFLPSVWFSHFSSPPLLKIFKRDGVLIFENNEKAAVLLPATMARSSTVIGLRFPLLICELFTPLEPEIYPAQEIGKGNRNFAHLERLAIEELTIRGWDAEYVAVRLATDLKLPDSMEDREQPLVVLAAARLGKTRPLDRAQPATDDFVPLRCICDRPAREMP